MPYQKTWAGQRSGYSDWLRAGRSGDRIPVGSSWGRGFPHLSRLAPGAHPASCKMGTEFFPGVKSGRGVTLTPHPFQCLWSPYGLYGLYRVSVPVQGCNLPSPYQKTLTSRRTNINPLNPELNPISYLLALLGVHFLHVSRIRVKSLTLRLLMSYIYIYIYIYIWSTYS